ncbi:hypothetical protein [Micromonospora rhizosphaerae]|nr:hypothetical protein [Micromonospora rhizosphaerae]
MREVLLGADPPVSLTQRAVTRLAKLREEATSWVHPGGTVIVRDREGEVRWWTWAAFRANATLVATLGELADPTQRYDDASIRLRPDLDREMWRVATGDAVGRICLPDVTEQALAGLKFSAALPARLATATLAARLADIESAAAVLQEPAKFAYL